jgi:hypothetical protein
MAKPDQLAALAGRDAAAVRTGDSNGIKLPFTHI